MGFAEPHPTLRAKSFPGSSIVNPDNLDELNKLRAQVSEGHDFTVFHVKTFDDLGSLGFEFGGVTVVRDASEGSVVNTVAHELGHALGASHEGREADDLMHFRYQQSHPDGIGKLDWDEVHPLETE